MSNTGILVVSLALLKRYLNKKEVAYYLTHIRKEAQRYPDAWTQVITVVQEKEKQPKFIKGTKQYKRNAIIDYVMKENLARYRTIDDDMKKSMVNMLE